MCSWKGLLDFKSEKTVVFHLLSGQGSASPPFCYFGEPVHKGRALHKLGSICLLPQAHHPLPTLSDRHILPWAPWAVSTPTSATTSSAHTHTHTHQGALSPQQKPLVLPTLRGQADRALGETRPGHTLGNSASEPPSAAAQQAAFVSWSASRCLCWWQVRG